jgi:hypothetical protein
MSDSEAEAVLCGIEAELTRTQVNAAQLNMSP